MNEPVPDLLVIGYGNELRGDDGVGPKVAEAVEQMKLPRVRAIACALLTPELAEAVSKSERVIFVDATVDESKEVRLRPLAPAESSQLMAHAADPGKLLAIARDVYGRYPKAWWLTIPIETLEFGDRLSPVAQQGFEIALEKIRSLALSEIAGV